MDSDDDEPPVLVDLAATDASLVEPPSEAPADTEEAADLPPCPVTILSGFLGSGKTTLVQYILKSPDHGKRIAVIENEFGEGLDVETLIARDGVDPNSNSLQDFIELPNGCICCTVKDSLVETLENLIRRRSDLDYILIEASGMANPGPIASVFWLDDALESRLRLDGIVTLVDANNILEQLETTEEAAQQVVYSDRLLVNKTDLVTDTKALQQIEKALRELHPTAPMKLTTYSKVPNLDWILGANCFGGVSRVEELDAIWNEAQKSDAENGHSHEHDHHDHSHEHGDHHDCDACQAHSSSAGGSHRHTDAVSTLAFQRPGSVDLTKLNAWLAEVLWPNQDESNRVLMALLQDPSQKDKLLASSKEKNAATHRSKGEMQLYRIKGIVSVKHDPKRELLEENETAYQDKMTGLDRRRYIIQAVHDLWEVHPASDDLQWKEDEERIAKLVVIGRHLPEERLRKGFFSCFVDSSENE